MKLPLKTALLSSALLLVSTTANAAPIVGLVNTGANAVGNVDQSWTLNGGTAFIGTPIPGAWVANTATSSWLTPAANGSASFDPTAAGLYSYALNFSLAGFDAATASFSGRFAVDNSIDAIFLNGTQITGSGGSFNGYTAFSSTPGAFLAGANTLTFIVRNFAQASGNPTGLRVEFLQSDAAVTAVPEAATWAMMIAGFGLVGAAMRSRKVRTSVRFG